jgi:hypothetical protein
MSAIGLQQMINRASTMAQNGLDTGEINSSNLNQVLGKNLNEGELSILKDAIDSGVFSGSSLKALNDAANGVGDFARFSQGGQLDVHGDPRSGAMGIVGGAVAGAGTGAVLGFGIPGAVVGAVLGGMAGWGADSATSPKD